MSRTSPFAAPTPLPPLPGQGADNFAPFSTERLYTMAEAAEYLRVEPRTIGHFINDARPNKLRASWVGRSWLITASALREFIEKQTSK